MLKVSVFCPDETVVEELALILSDRGDVAIQLGFPGLPGQLELDRHLRLQSPGAILVSSDGNADTIQFVEYVRRTYPSLTVIVLCPSVDQGAALLRPFMRAGIRDVIFKPFDRREVWEVIDRVCVLPPPDAIEKTGKVMCFLPSKPGVGASTVALNTAIALAQVGNRVLLVDGDLTSSMIGFLLKLKNPTSIWDAERRIADLDELLWPEFVTKVREGLDVLHAGKVTLTESLDSAILQSLTDFWRTSYDVVCFDFSGNMEPYSVDVMRGADRIFFICTAEVASLYLLAVKLQLMKGSDVMDRVRIIQNRKTHSDDLSKRQIEELTGVPVSKVFRNSYAETMSAGREGRAIRANSALGAEFKAFAAELSGKPAPSATLIRQIVSALAQKARAFRAAQPKVVGSGMPQLAACPPRLSLPAPEPREIVPSGS